MKVPRRWWLCAAIVVAAGCTQAGEVPSPDITESGTATPIATSRGSSASPRAASASPSASRRAAVDWETLCVVAPLEGIDDNPTVKAPDTAWDSDGLVITNSDGDLVANWQGHDYPIFDGDVEQEDDPTPRDVFTGEVQANERWVLFVSADSLEISAPWRLHIWDKQNPTKPARVIGQYTGGADNPGFPMQRLRGDHVVWTQPVRTDVRSIHLANLADGTERTLVEGPVYDGMFVDNNTVVWQAQRGGPAVTVEEIDLQSGAISKPDNPLATMDSRGGHLVTDGEYWVLAFVPSGDPDSEDTTYDMWAWHPDWSKPKRFAQLKAPGYVSSIQPMADGRLGLDIFWDRAYIVDLRTGIAQALKTGWAVVEPDETKVTLSWEGPDPNSGATASVPISQVAQPGACVDKIRGE